VAAVSAQHTPGPFVQIKRPRRWGIPTPAQFNLLAECITKGGSTFQVAHSLGTVRACVERQWVTLRIRRYASDDNLITITDQGRACVSMNSEEQQ
jgi:hypothetical protein